MRPPRSHTAYNFRPSEGAAVRLAAARRRNRASLADRVKGRAARGFTLLELLVVISIIALATAGVGLAMRDGGQAQLQREGERLAALLESARAQSRASGTAVRWRADANGFHFEGLPGGSTLPSQWLDPATGARPPAVLRLGPEPLIGPQQVVLGNAALPGQGVRVSTDGLRPFIAELLP